MLPSLNTVRLLWHPRFESRSFLLPLELKQKKMVPLETFEGHFVSRKSTSIRENKGGQQSITLARQSFGVSDLSLDGESKNNNNEERVFTVFNSAPSSLFNNVLSMQFFHCCSFNEVCQLLFLSGGSVPFALSCRSVPRAVSVVVHRSSFSPHSSLSFPSDFPTCLTAHTVASPLPLWL